MKGNLERKGGFSDTRLSSYEDEGASDNAAAEKPVNFPETYRDPGFRRRIYILEMDRPSSQVSLDSP